MTFEVPLRALVRQVAASHDTALPSFGALGSTEYREATLVAQVAPPWRTDCVPVPSGQSTRWSVKKETVSDFHLIMWHLAAVGQRRLAAHPQCLSGSGKQALEN